MGLFVLGQRVAKLVTPILVLTLALEAAACHQEDCGGSSGCEQQPTKPSDPPTQSTLRLNIVDYAPEPLRAELDLAGAHSSWGFSSWPCEATKPDAALSCLTTTDGEELCQLSCPGLVNWQASNGTACMHQLSLVVPDDGTDPEPLTLQLQMRLYTYGGALVVDASREVLLPTLADHREGYFHSAEIQWKLDNEVFAALHGSSIECLGTSQP